MPDGPLIDLGYFQETSISDDSKSFFNRDGENFSIWIMDFELVDGQET
jgi:hypothetical protein